VTNAQIVALGVRLFSIWLVLYLFGHAPGLWTFIEHGKSGSGAGFVVTVSAVLLLAAVGLWFFPLAVARKLLPKATLDQPTPLPVEQVQRAGFCLLGLWVLTEAVPDLIYYAVAFTVSTKPSALMSFEKDTYANVAHTIAEFVIGVWLLLGARGLVGVLRWARTAGAAEPSNSAVESDGRQESPAAPHRER
jgi:hypothetical protein